MTYVSAGKPLIIPDFDVYQLELELSSAFQYTTQVQSDPPSRVARMGSIENGTYGPMQSRTQASSGADANSVHYVKLAGEGICLSFSQFDTTTLKFGLHKWGWASVSPCGKQGWQKFVHMSTGQIRGVSLCVCCNEERHQHEAERQPIL